MRREVRAYVLDIVEACDAIALAVHGLELDAYRTNRIIRSAVEREFITIGEAVAAERSGAAVRLNVKRGYRGCRDRPPE